MSEKEAKRLVAKIIINIEKPFSLERLLNDCMENGISDIDLILEVLEMLCDAGIVKYSEILNDCWAYVPIA